LLAQALGLDNQQITQGKISYDLRRLRLHGLIQRIAGTHRYELTAIGRRAALLYSRVFSPKYSVGAAIRKIYLCKP